MVKIDTPLRQTIAAIGLLLIGGTAGAAATHALQPVVVMAPAAPTAISGLSGIENPAFSHAIVAVKGRIAEVYGESFILEDGTGRVLITARQAGGFVPAVGQTVTVQGHMHGTSLRPMFIAGADGRAYAVGRMGGRHGDHKGRRERPGRAGPDGAVHIEQPGAHGPEAQPAASVSLAN
ncbi:hypothetical protein GVO57_14040 (plasmid) [Sphingomonas changnyeongensis]|uniref:Uncharacterized protein n=1 Tax=Sphingomonas changnyeongensis TaxID=2698679 RepID=A0A7Z2NY81_9SPHN|nr:hypothetical protein [Sphingomonas changnyeongensis]QHL92013.1 hypothetical protein GVO57_14040 [Sphingomonas changnyeongensis]